mgnify:CR=1 FL=1
MCFEDDIFQLRKDKSDNVSGRNIQSEEEQMLLYEPHAVNIHTGEIRLPWYRELGFNSAKIQVDLFYGFYYKYCSHNIPCMYFL